MVQVGLLPGRAPLWRGLVALVLLSRCIHGVLVAWRRSGGRGRADAGARAARDREKGDAAV
jgi:hypothetical protein